MHCSNNSSHNYHSLTTLAGKVALKTGAHGHMGSKSSNLVVPGVQVQKTPDKEKTQKSPNEKAKKGNSNSQTFKL